LPQVTTRLAKEGDVDAVAALFDGYRQFYGQAPDLAGSKVFIAERMGRGDSVVIVAEDGGEPIGFAQLYPSFTSVRMSRIFILNDLFVAPAHRGTGGGRALLEAAADWARQSGAVRLTLTTQKENSAAKRAYERAGWARDEEFDTYNLRLVG
jgi:GNAT superfamily N-acetyltransferase